MVSVALDFHGYELLYFHNLMNLKLNLKINMCGDPHQRDDSVKLSVLKWIICRPRVRHVQSLKL